MGRKPLTISLTLAAVSLLFICGCKSRDENAGVQKVSPERKTVVLRPVPASGPMVRIRMHWYSQAQFAGYMIAYEKGFFDKNGVKNVRIDWGSEAESPLEILTKGQADFAIGFLAQGVTKASRDVPITHLLQLNQRSAYMLIARKSSGIETYRDLDGKRIGLWGGMFDILPKAFLEKNKIHYKPVQQTSSLVPFLRGAVDVVSAMEYNEYHSLIESGLRREDLKVFAFSDFGMDFPEDGLYCNSLTFEKKPELCKAVAKSVIQGWDYAFKNEAETLDIVMAYCRLSHIRTNRNHQRWMLRTMKKMMVYRVGSKCSEWGRLDRQAYQETAEFLKAEGIIKKIPDYEIFHKPALVEIK